MLVITQLAKYLFIILLLLFSLRDYTYFRYRTEEKRRKSEGRQLFDIYVFDILGFGIIFMNTWDMKVALLLAGIFIYMAFTSVFYKVLYPKASILLVNNMLMLLGIGFIMIARLNLSQALKQFVIAAGGTVIAFLIPVIIRRLRVLERLTWLYAALGLLALAGVLALAAVSGGAKLSVTVGGVTIQFSELVKITLVFFMAAKLAQSTSFRSVAVTTVIAALHVIILVLSTDLGTALVFFITYVVVVFVAAHNVLYPIAGLSGGVLASIAAYFLFGHVRQRVTAWKDPFAVYANEGYQIVQGLFAIGAGGWFGMGLMNGAPKTIPVASKDYIFAAICEEFGAVFCIALILICMNTFLLIVNISMQIRNRFYKLVAVGLGTEYAFQVFLTIGGVTKFIPLTGITLPLVAYGGSSVISTIIMLAIVQGMYMLREDEGEELERLQRYAG